MPDNKEWQLEVSKQLGELCANQKNMHEKLDTYNKTSQERLDKLEDIVIGNGKPGLSEEMRLMKGRWAFFYGIIIILLSAVANQTVSLAFGHKAAAEVIKATAVTAIVDGANEK